MSEKILLPAVFMEKHNWSIFTGFWKESMINQLANLINRNRSVVKIYYAQIYNIIKYISLLLVHADLDDGSLFFI